MAGHAKEAVTDDIVRAKVPLIRGTLRALRLVARTPQLQKEARSRALLHIAHCRAHSQVGCKALHDKLVEADGGLAVRHGSAARQGERWDDTLRVLRALPIFAWLDQIDVCQLGDTNRQRRDFELLRKKLSVASEIVVETRLDRSEMWIFRA